MAEHDCALMNCLGRLEVLEDRVTRLNLEQHRHTDLPDGYAGAYARGFQDGFAHVQRAVESLLQDMVGEPIPAAAARSAARVFDGTSDG